MSGHLIQVIPDDAPPVPKTRGKKDGSGKFTHYPITHLWPYHNKYGQITHYVCRIETPEGKETLQLTLWEEGGKKIWRSKWYSRPLPIFNLHLIAQCRSAQIIVVEGEKCADALQKLIDEAGHSARIVVTTAAGGTNNYDKSDWSVIQGRKVLLWEDHDLQNSKPREKQPGHKAMLTVAGFMKKYGNECRMVNPYGLDKPAGWDVADAILEEHWTFADVFQFMKTRSEPIPESVDIPDEYTPPIETYDSEVEQLPLPPETIAEISPIRALGYDHGNYYYMPRSTRQITALTPKEHSPSNLMHLAPLTYWERMYPSKQGPLWKNAANDLMRACESEGLFDTDKLRGRGAWVDGESVVLHLGDCAIVDGEVKGLTDIMGDYIYQEAKSMKYNPDIKPLKTDDAHKLLKICDSLLWKRDIYSRYFGGWLVLAPICGALSWRPHIWLTGGAGTGKTWVLEQILSPCLGNFKMQVQSNTTEAGIRQWLKSDSLPIVFDEIETENNKAQDRVQHVLELARQASSESGAGIVKGSQSGRAIEYKIRSMFCFSSINVALHQQADISRVTVVTMQVPHDWTEDQKESHFSELSERVFRTVTPEYCAQLRARTVNLIPVIRQNSRVFAAAAASTIGTRRAGDQIGTLLAGAYTLSSSNLVTLEKAKEWLAQRNWDEERQTTEAADISRCLNVILEAKTKISGVDLTISNLLFLVNDYVQVESDMLGVDREAAMAGLAQCGIKYSLEDGQHFIYIATNHSALKRILEKTPWSGGWHRILSRIKGASVKAGQRFAGIQTRAVRIPWGEVF